MSFKPPGREDREPRLRNSNSNTSERTVMRKTILTVLALLALVVPAAEAASLKKIVAVSRFENKTSWRGQVSIDDGLAEQLTDALMQSGRFVVMERKAVADVIGEQDFADSGRVQKAKSAQTGKLVGAQVLVMGTITEFEQKSAGSASGVGIGGFRVGNKKEEAHVGLIVRLVDTTTGEVIASERVEGKAEAGGVKFGVNRGGVQFGTQGFDKTPMGKAVQMAIDDAVSKIAAGLKDVPFEARVIKVNSDDEILISGGEKTGMAPGDTFTLYSAGEDLVDPFTGESLGTELEKQGTVKVVSVQEKYAKAATTAPIPGMKPGDIVKEQ